MGIENREISEGDFQKENPDEIIIFADNNSVGTYYRGRRSDMSLLAGMGGDPLEVKNLKVNDNGQIYNSVEWDDGEPTKLDWIDVYPIPEQWKKENSSQK